MNELHDGNLLKQALCNEPFKIDTHFHWVNADLKPGKIKEVKDVSWLKPYMANTSREIKPGQLISNFSFQCLDMNDHIKIVLAIPGKKKSDMIETYRTLNNRLQSCITYY